MKTRRYYFTFGSDPLYPFGRNDYVVVDAESADQAGRLFQAVHPNRPYSNCLNCAFIYTEPEFNGFRDHYYHHVNPIETITLRRKEEME